MLMARALTIFASAVFSALAIACNRSPQAPPSSSRPQPADARVRALADSYLEGFFERNPDAVTLYGVPGAHHDRLPDNSFDALHAWHAKEDAWLAEAKPIDPANISAAPLDRRARGK